MPALSEISCLTDANEPANWLPSGYRLSTPSSSRSKCRRRSSPLPKFPRAIAAKRSASDPAPNSTPLRSDAPRRNVFRSRSSLGSDFAIPRTNSNAGNATVAADSESNAGVEPPPTLSPVMGSPFARWSQQRPRNPVATFEVPSRSPSHQRRIMSKCDKFGFETPMPSTKARRSFTTAKPFGTA